MNVVLVSLTVLVSLVLVSLVLGAAGGLKVAATPDMRRRAAHLGYSVGAYRAIGGLELAGVAGILVGIAIPALAVAAAAGLLLMMCGAVVSHLRSGDSPFAALPAAVVALVTAALLTVTIVAA